MSSTDIAATITAIEHATWIVDHAYMPQRPHVDDNGVVTPVEDPAPPRLAVEVIEEKIRPDKRGVKRQGLTVRMFMILLFVAAGHGRVQVKDLLTLALSGLPLQMQRDLGIQYWTSRHGKPELRTLTAKQLYTLIDNIREHLVRRGLQGLRDGQPLIGRIKTRRNVAAAVYADAVLLGSLPKLEQSRLRTTWLATLMTRPVPLAVILTAAGLKSTRTLFDLLPHLDTGAAAGTVALRDGGAK